jgi:AraC-like DNA-binding protein/mannose-6-phosphate isomerase-like protein (cupin superfamily)
MMIEYMQAVNIMTDYQNYPYLNMYNGEQSGISVEYLHESRSANMHCHQYYELLIINRGSLRHVFRDVETLLIPGDVVMILPGMPHGYSLYGESSLYNCQFTIDHIDEAVKALLIKNEGTLLAEEGIPDTFAEHFEKRENMYRGTLPEYAVNNGKQNVLHLSPQEHVFVKAMLHQIMDSPDEEDIHSRLCKQKYLEIVLLELDKKLHEQHEILQSSSNANQQMMAEVLAKIEYDLTQPFDIQMTASQYCFSPNHFRKIFKDFTGVTPIQYINRLRIILACEEIEEQHIDIKKAAETVGIYDLSYFNRLFKKYIGCAPNKLRTRI